MIGTSNSSARLSALFVIASALAAYHPATAHADAAVYQKLLPATAWVVTDLGLGSGVLIDSKRRLLVTNEHVVGEQTTVTVVFPEFTDGSLVAEVQHYKENLDRMGIKGRVLLTDARRDLALVQLDSIPQGTAAVPLALASPSPGETVHSIGNSGASGALWVYTGGNVRAVYRKRFKAHKIHEMRIVETQSPINPGDSGGPVVNAKGQLVGLSQSFNLQARLITNCVDISEIRGLMGEERALNRLVASTGLKILRETPRTYAVESNVGGSSRTVFIAKSADQSGKAELRRVFAVATTIDGTLSSEMTEKLRGQNARTERGSWEVESTPKGKTLVLFSLTADTTSADKLASAVEYVAKTAGTFK